MLRRRKPSVVQGNRRIPPCKTGNVALSESKRLEGVDGASHISVAQLTLRSQVGVLEQASLPRPRERTVKLPRPPLARASGRVRGIKQGAFGDGQDAN